MIKEFSENYYLRPNCDDGHCDQSGRFCVLVKYDDFMENPDKYINKAYDIQENIDLYDFALCKDRFDLVPRSYKRVK